MKLNSIKKVLILREDALGDMVIAIPAIKAVYDALDQPSITVLASNYSRNADILHHLPFIDEIMISPNIQSFKDMWAFSKILRNKGFDLSIHLSTRAGTAWACFFSIPNNIGDKAILGLLPVFFKLGRFYPPHDMMSHQIQRNFFLLKSLGISETTATTTPLYLAPHPDDSDPVRRKLEAKGFEFNRPTIGLHIGAAGAKPVLPEKYAAYAMEVHRRRPDIQWVITGASSEEKEFRDRFLSHIQFPVIDMVGATSIREMMTLLPYFSIFVGVDTGPAHMAAALQVPQLLMSTSKRILPFKWGPWLNRHLVVRANDQCAYTCHARECPHWICSDDLPVHLMADYTLGILKEDGVVSFEDQQLYWFQTSLPLLLLVDDATREKGQRIHQIWTQWGFKIHIADRDDPQLYDRCVAADIRIIQNLTGQKKFKLLIFSQWLNQNLSHPPLLCHGIPPILSPKDMVRYYRERFSKRIL
jgi:ADP-heptose:LPS heptosyltransferase